MESRKHNFRRNGELLSPYMLRLIDRMERQLDGTFKGYIKRGSEYLFDNIKTDIHGNSYVNIFIKNKKYYIFIKK